MTTPISPVKNGHKTGGLSSEVSRAAATPTYLARIVDGYVRSEEVHCVRLLRMYFV